MDEGHTCEIYSFSLQYPSFLFPGKSQYSDEAAPAGISIHTCINSVNPLNWIRVGNRISRLRPDLVVVRFWIPFMGPALGSILRRIRKNGHTRIVCIADNVLPHEKRPGDGAFLKYFLSAPHAFVTMSEKVMGDLRSFQPRKPARMVVHPLYDSFGEKIRKEEARAHLHLPAEKKIILFFGFIRHYKGLDILLDAMKDPRISASNIHLLVAGEFYEDEKKYQEQLDRNEIRERVILRTDFIPDREVRYYLCAADAVVQPYRNATQSGVTPLAYHFEKPMIVTRVGGLPDLVPHEKAGLVAEPQPASIADAILRYYELGEDFFIHHLREEKKKYSWSKLVNAILEMADQGNQ